MSTLLWPTFPGQTLDVKRTGPLWKVAVDESDSGKETRTQRWTIPRYKWELVLEFARAGGNTINVVNTGGTTQFTGYETAALLWFVNSVQAKWDYFYLNDPYLVQLAYYQVGGTPIGPPTSPGCSGTTGGALSTSTTYYYFVTSVTALGESIQSAEASFGTGSDTAIVLSWTAPSPSTGVVGYNIYRATASGLEQWVAYVSGVGTLSYTDLGANLAPNGPLPQVKVRLDMSDLEIAQLSDYSRVWSAKTIKMVSVK